MPFWRFKDNENIATLKNDSKPFQTKLSTRTCPLPRPNFLRATAPQFFHPLNCMFMSTCMCAYVCMSVTAVKKYEVHSSELTMMIRTFLAIFRPFTVKTSNFLAEVWGRGESQQAVLHLDNQSPLLRLFGGKLLFLLLFSSIVPTKTFWETN